MKISTTQLNAVLDAARELEVTEVDLTLSGDTPLATLYAATPTHVIKAEPETPWAVYERAGKDAA